MSHCVVDYGIPNSQLIRVVARPWDDVELQTAAKMQHQQYKPFFKPFFVVFFPNRKPLLI